MENMVVCPHCNKEFSLELECLRCGHKWRPRQDKLPLVCPNLKCKSPYWNIPRKPKPKKKNKGKN